MSNAAHLLPGRLRAAASALANAWIGRRGEAARDDILDLISETLFADVVADARVALDAADAASPDPGQRSADPARLRINVAAAVGLDLEAQAVVLLDVGRDGTVTVSTWARLPGTPALAIAEWAGGLERHALTVVPFRTVFGWGRNGRPTPLTPEERASLGEAGRAYADRNSEEPAL